MHATHTVDDTATRDAVLAWARRLYHESVDRKDAAGFAAAFTPDAWLRFGNNDRLVGREAIREAIAGFFTAMAALEHTPRNAWLQGDTLILEAEVTYTRHDGRLVTVPAVTIYRLASLGVPGESDPLADQCRIYVDLAPLFAP